jgi:hypothetical protein
MAVPALYDEQALAEYMHRIVGPIAGALRWAVEDASYQEIVSDALLAFGQTDLTQITGDAEIAKLRTVARWAVWRAAVEQLSAAYDYTTEGQTFNRSQMQKAAQTALDRSERELSSAGLGNWKPIVSRAVHIHDPYVWLPDEQRVIP